MNRIDTATEKTTVVRIGKGLSLHAQAKGVEGAWAACGTVSSKFGAAKNILGTVSCRKCLDTIAAEEALEAQQVREAEMAAEETHAAMLLEDHAAEIAAEVEARRTGTVEAPAAEVATEAPAAGWVAAAPAPCMGEFTVGQSVATKDGRVWTVIGPAQGNTTIKLTDGTKTTFRFAHNLTAA